MPISWLATLAAANKTSGWQRTLSTPSNSSVSRPPRRRPWQLEPPDILLTTPESLAVMLARREARDLFASLSWVVVDEVHALAESKRGADLALSLERLEEIAGRRLQRIGLSATCAPLAEVARFLVGVGRPCTVAQVAEGAPL